MGQRPGREQIMTALFNVLVASVQASFTADTTENSAVLSSPSSLTDLFIGLPVFGAGISRGAVITALSPLTLSIPATANGTAVAMTTGFQTVGRRLKFWTDGPPQPALYLRGADEDISSPNVLQLQVIQAEIWIMTNAGEDPDAVPEIALNNLLDAVQSAFAPDNFQTRQFTLGGLVSWCRIEGRIEKDPGDANGQAIAVADVVITVP